MTFCTIKTTRLRGASGAVRVKAEGYARGARLSKGWNYGNSDEDNHKEAALELARRQGWYITEDVIGVPIPGREPAMLWTVPADAVAAGNVIMPGDV